MLCQFFQEYQSKSIIDYCEQTNETTLLLAYTSNGKKYNINLINFWCFLSNWRQKASKVFTHCLNEIRLQKRRRYLLLWSEFEGWLFSSFVDAWCQFVVGIRSRNYEKMMNLCWKLVVFQSQPYSAGPSNQFTFL